MTRREKSGRRPASAALYLPFLTLVGEVFRLNGSLLDVADALARDLRVTPTHWQIMAVVRHRQLTIPAISRRVGLRRQSVRHNIKQLVARGLIEQAANPDHRRASLIRLSGAGQLLMEELVARQVEIARIFTAGLGLRARDLESISTALRRMREKGEAAGVPAPGGGLKRA